jgi:hypothetical protein
MEEEKKQNQDKEPFYIYLENSQLNEKLQKYISDFIQHIASITEKEQTTTRRVISFLPERNGILLLGFKQSTVKVIYHFLKKLDEEKRNINFEVNLVLVESHKMTSGFKF